jgi:hypothetical protein
MFQHLTVVTPSDVGMLQHIVVEATVGVWDGGLGALWLLQAAVVNGMCAARRDEILWSMHFKHILLLPL